MNNWLHSAHVSKQQSRQEPKCSNTSTDVEKTRSRESLLISSWKHLHGRGEDSRMSQAPRFDLETPPRTWRRRAVNARNLASSRNTSPDVEKTSSTASLSKRFKKHLHGRGEDSIRVTFPSVGWETPPRTWRRRGARAKEWVDGRNTSTDVEKTPTEGMVQIVAEKHLHGRGEDL